MMAKPVAALFGNLSEECPQCRLQYVDGYNFGYALGKNDERVRLKSLLLKEIEKQRILFNGCGCEEDTKEPLLDETSAQEMMGIETPRLMAKRLKAENTTLSPFAKSASPQNTNEELYIKWRLKNDDNYHAFNNMGEWLGYLRCEMVGRHKQWCWYQTSGIRMSPGCLQEVRNEQKELFTKR